MTTLLKIEANRENALASTGPRTTQGRAIVSGNAIRHGLLSWKPVVTGLENPEDWQTHLDRTLDSLAPVGYMETLLAERVALLLWRLLIGNLILRGRMGGEGFSGMPLDQIQTKMQRMRTPELPPLFLKVIDPDQLLQMIQLQLSGELPDRHDAEQPPRP